MSKIEYNGTRTNLWGKEKEKPKFPNRSKEK